ncbi:maleylpyruvate isomerase family mycothiol-dependent enzyme [Streptomyces sp. CC228A]|uniref:maleylpyruvate isomerase family mycothiol-dependent enzyme n=1 Tax=Streptomyces sp. CC228A TaxID=2898186 RepID=UPI001F20A3C9|nr:maleylpyruvate isomerase family mycothiol-dependent enzyme [Streptomyces sp. CC228A]
MSEPARAPGGVLDDLRDESDALDRLVAALPPERWAAPTPAPRWSVAHQIAHLAWTDEAALLAATDPEAFAGHVAEAAAAPGTFVDAAAAALAAQPPDALRERWRAARARLQDALRALLPGTRVPWYGPPMSVTALATARLMETWAHGQDVADALGAVRTPTARLRHVAWIGVRARDYAFAVRGLTPPAEEFRVELEAPESAVRGLTPPAEEFRVELEAPDSAATWAFGPPDAPQRVTGPALDFCLLVTRRAHRADLALHAAGPDADRWLDIAQAFAGPPGEDRAPRKETR